MPTLLYYPLVGPPTEVLHQALLYWDDIASVVPEDPAVYEHAVSNDLKELKDQGLYHPIALGTHLRQPLRSSIECRVLLEELRDLAAGPSRPHLAELDSFLLNRNSVAPWKKKSSILV